MPPKKKGEASVDVTFTYDINGVLVVDVKNNQDGKIHTKVISQNLEGNELQKEVAYLKGIKLKAQDDIKNDVIKARLLSIYESAATYDRERIGSFIKQYDYYMANGTQRTIRNYRNYISSMIEAYEQSLSDYDVFNPDKAFYEDYDYETDEDESGDEDI